MKKGQVLDNQRFERYFMAKIEIVDAVVVDVVGEYQLVVEIGNERHRVDFSLGGTMRSKERLEARKERKTQKHNVSDETRALCKRIGYSVRLYQAVEFWMVRHWLRCRGWEWIHRCKAGLCDRF